MRILVVSNLYHPHVRGGYELAARQTVEGLRARGHRVTVMTEERPGEPADPDVVRTLRLTPVYDGEFLAGLEPAARRAAMATGYLHDARNVAALLSAVDAVRPDVVYCWNLAGLGALGLLATAHALGTPVVLHLMDYYPETIATLVGAHRGAYLAFMNRACRPGIVCCSDTVRGHVRAAGIDVDVEVMHNWVAPESVAQKTEYPTPERPLRVAYVGQLLPEKGLDIVLDAVASLPVSIRGRVRLDLIGRGAPSEIQRLHGRIRTHGLDAAVRLEPPRAHEQMLATYRDYDVLVFVTHAREPFAFVPLEAMAAGLAVVLGDEGGNAEIGRDGENCLLVPRDAAVVGRALARLVESPGLVETLGRTARAFVTKRHDATQAFQRVESLLAQHAARGRAASDADIARVADLHAVFGAMEPLLASDAPLAAATSPSAWEPGGMRRAIWALLGEGETARKRAWRAGKRVARQAQILPRRLVGTSSDVLRLSSHLGWIAHRLDAADRAITRSFAVSNGLAQTAEALGGELRDVRARLDTLGTDVADARSEIDGTLRLLATRLDALVGTLATLGPRLDAIQQKGDATNADLSGLVAHLRYVGLLPESLPDDGSPPPVPIEWPRETVDRCIVCGGNDFAPWGTKDGFPIVRCVGCDLLLVSPRLRADIRYQLYSPQYWAEHMRRYRLPTFWERLTVDYAAALKRVALLAEFATGRRVVDIGCSNGALVRRAAEWGFEAYGLELTPEVAREAERLSGRPVFAGDLGAGTDALGGQRFDHATLFDLLEHIYDPRAFLANLREVIVPRGRVIVETFRTDCEDFRRLGIQHDDVKPVEHIYMYRERHVEQLLEQHGFHAITKRHPLGDQHSRVIFVVERDP